MNQTIRIVIGSVLMLLLGSVSHATDLYWSGTGTWDTTSQIWGTASGGPYNQATWSNGTPDAAIFEGPAGTVTLGSAITAAGLIFDVDGYTLDSSTLTLSTTGTAITGNASATINSAVALSGNQTWSVASGQMLTLGGVVSGTSTLTYGGSGSYEVNAANTASGSLTINGATVAVGGSGVLMASGFGFSGFRSVTLTNGGTLAGRGFVIMGQVNDGAGSVVFGSGGGTFRATASADLGATVNKGFLVNANQTGVFEVPAGIDASWSGSFSDRDFQVNAGGMLDFDIDGTFTTSRNLQGAGDYKKSGTGTLVLTGSSSYAGSTMISAGTLQYGSGGISSVTLPSGSIGGTGDLIGTARAITLGGAVSLSGSGAVSITQTNAGAFPNAINLASGNRTITAASITLSGDVGNNDSDNGSLALDTSAANGAMDLNISLGRSGVTFIPASFSANAGTGVITVSGTGPGSSGWRSTPVTLAGDINITAAVNSAAAVTLNQTNTNPGVVSGILSGGMTVIKAGTGTLAATAVNTFTGGLVVNAGIFEASAATGTSPNSAMGLATNAVTVNAGGTLLFSVSRGAGFHTGSAAINGGRITFNAADASFASGNTVTFGTAAGTIDGTGQLRRRDSGNQIVVNAAASGSVISVANLNLLDNSPVFNVADGSQAADLTISGGITGGSTLTKTGTGTLAVTGSNTLFSGATAINAGTLLVGNANALGTSGGITIGASGTFGVDAGVAFSRPLTITAGGRVNLGDGASVALPSAAALSAFESTSPSGSLTNAEILFGSGSTTPSALTSGWVAKPSADYFSDILSLDGTGSGNTYVLSMSYEGFFGDMNIWYRTGTSGPFTPLGTSFVGTQPWSGQNTVGQYGVDTTSSTVWVVTDHNSQFVIVPEPTTIVLLAAAGLAAAVARRRRDG